ncbi:MAG: hypothetical protein K2I00_04800 [Ruminococcus sp.]|nr:hypothetical protein [Ruminococcus sp.]
MIYSSLGFIYLFFPASLIIYYAVPRKAKDIVLFLMSCVFTGLMGLKILAFTALYIAVNYIAAHLTYRMAVVKRRQLRLIPCSIGIFFDILMIFGFRSEYFSFITAPLNLPDGVFPIGISFFTLSAVGYLMEIYRGEVKADMNIVRFSLYLIMFPRLIFGSLMSYSVFVSALRRRRMNIMEIGRGLSLFVKGLGKKVIAADSLYALYSAVVSTDTGNLSLVSAWLGVISYVLCLYFTMSGFSDMSTGLCRCFGFRFPGGFNYPMFSGKIRFFAAKWQVQAVQWFRRNITRPLTVLIDNPRLNKIIFILVWAIGGFWYGFSVGSMIFGFLMGTAIIIENRFRNLKFMKSNGILYTSFAVMLMSVFLMSDEISDAFRYLWAMVGGNGTIADSLAAYFARYYIVVLLAAVYASTDLFKNMVVRVENSRFRWAVYVFSPAVSLLLLMICTAMMSYSGSSGILLLM